MLADSDGASVVSTSSVDSGARPAPCKLRGRRFVTCTSGSKRQRVRYDSSDQEAQLIRAAACSPASSVSGASVASAASRFTGAAPRTRTFSDDNSSVGDAPVVQPTRSQDTEDAHMTEKARRDARRIRNRRSAAISRKRKRDYTKKLEGQVGSLNEANALLLAKLVQVQAERNWFEARASATTPSGAGAAGFNAAASAADAGEAALAAFQLALKQQAAVVEDQRRQRMRADMGMPTAAAPAPLLPAAPAAQHSAHSDAALSACVDAALDVSSAGMPRAGQAPLAPPPAVITSTAHPLRDAEMSRSDAPVTTYSRESTVFAFIAALALMPGMAWSRELPAHPSWSRAQDVMAAAVMASKARCSTSKSSTWARTCCASMASSAPTMRLRRLPLITA